MNPRPRDVRLSNHDDPVVPAARLGPHAGRPEPAGALDLVCAVSELGAILASVQAPAGDRAPRPRRAGGHRTRQPAAFLAARSSFWTAARWLSVQRSRRSWRYGMAAAGLPDRFSAAPRLKVAYAQASSVEDPHA